MGGKEYARRRTAAREEIQNVPIFFFIGLESQFQSSPALSSGRYFQPVGENVLAHVFQSSHSLQGRKPSVIRTASSTAANSSWLSVSILERSRDLSSDRI